MNQRTALGRALLNISGEVPDTREMFRMSPEQREELSQRPCLRPSVTHLEGRGGEATMVPCYGFKNDGPATAFYETSPLRDRFDIFAPVAGPTYYIPTMPFLITDNFSASNLLTVGRHNVPRLPMWVNTDPGSRPEGAYNVIMLVSGKGVFEYTSRFDQTMSLFWRRMNDGYRDCVTVWERLDGTGFSSGLPTHVPERHLFFARAGRGVVFSKVAKYDASGKFAGVVVHVAEVEFQIFDKKPGQRDRVRVRATRYTFDLQTYIESGTELPFMAKVATSDFEDSNTVFAGNSPEAHYLRLIRSARRQFNTHCQIIPPKTERWVNGFLDQVASLKHNKAGVFSRRLTDFGDNWRGALNEVREPWQLRVFGEVFWGQLEEVIPEGYESNFLRKVQNAVNSVTDMRRMQELTKMYNDFVEPATSFFNNNPHY